jgi:hypothetical protein
VARRSDGSVVAWGDNADGQCNVPALPGGLAYVEVDASLYHSMARRSDGSLVGWGSNLYGQTDVPALPGGLAYAEVATGGLHNLARRSDGSVVAWGWNGYGQWNVPLLPSGLTYVEVAAGYAHNLARRSDGSVVAWGYNLSGPCEVPALASGLVYAEVEARSARSVARIQAAPNFSSSCDPGAAGVIPCPCSNAPSGPGRGCDNSTGTGGAFLYATGIAHLSMDSLVFTTSGGNPRGLSVVMQGSASAPAGSVFGRGVSCLGGALLRRLFAKEASAGAITAPDFGAGDDSVSARSAALGDAIQAGESRWYLVCYRDRIVPGGCPAGSTFNATQTGRVNWSL